MRPSTQLQVLQQEFHTQEQVRTMRNYLKTMMFWKYERMSCKLEGSHVNVLFNVISSV